MRSPGVTEKYVKKYGIKRCELCGSKKVLEAHHIIPVVCGGSDNDENLIAICSACHSKLTPRSELTKYGIQLAIKRNNILIAETDFFESIEAGMRTWEVLDEVSKILKTIHKILGWETNETSVHDK